MVKYRIAVGIPTLKDCSLEAIACTEHLSRKGISAEWENKGYFFRVNTKKDISSIPDSTSQALYSKDLPFGFCDWIKTLPYSELIIGERVIISLPNGEVVAGKVQSWIDYEDGDQIQVKIDGVTYLVHSSQAALITGKEGA